MIIHLHNAPIRTLKATVQIKQVKHNKYRWERQKWGGGVTKKKRFFAQIQFEFRFGTGNQSSRIWEQSS